MSENVLSTIAALETALSNSEVQSEKIGLLARGLRWQPVFDREDLAALTDFGRRVRGQRGAGFWEAERAVLEILSEHAGEEHISFLKEIYESRGAHGDDRRRLALQCFSRLAAVDNNGQAFRILERALKHHKSDTRGWTIGFISNAFSKDGALPESIIQQFRYMAEEDINKDVRVEAAVALEKSGHAVKTWVDSIISSAMKEIN